MSSRGGYAFSGRGNSTNGSNWGNGQRSNGYSNGGGGRSNGFGFGGRGGNGGGNRGRGGGDGGSSNGYSNGYSRVPQNGYGNHRDNGNGVSGRMMAIHERSIEKCFYKEHPSVSARSQPIISQWLEQNEVTLEGQDLPKPVFEFKEASFPTPIERLLYQSYKTPTIIQSISWPVALSGRDMVGIAQTGSGKTLGFLLPGIVHTLKQDPLRPSDGPIVLVILPTRELAQQVEEVAKAYCAAMNLGLACVYGGADKGPQKRALKGAHICVATPGRLTDFLNFGATNLNRCSYLVLDEADRMLDMGFEPQIRQIVRQIRVDRQTLMFSATWPADVRKLARDFQTEEVFLNVGSLEISASHNITQNVEVIEEDQKTPRLYQLLDQISYQEECKTIIFCETKRKTEDLYWTLKKHDWPAVAIHGDKSQEDRDAALNAFREGHQPILLATDVAARGLDVPDVKFVINYDYPNNSEDYVHRIGRTGRRDTQGTAFTFFTPKNGYKARDLIKVMEEANQKVSQELIALTTARYDDRRSNGRFRGRNDGPKNWGRQENSGEDYDNGSWGRPQTNSSASNRNNGGWGNGTSSWED